MSYQESPLVSEYIAQFPSEIQSKLQQLRVLIQKAFPDTIEDISYDMPTYRPAPKKRGIVHFAHFDKHIGLYAVFMPAESDELYHQLAPYNTGKGTLQFSHEKPLPVELIEKALNYHAKRF